jgi:hypothetical protein
MALAKLDFQPGINKENTPYSTEGGWEDSDKIRFRSGRPEKIGGWDKYSGDVVTGLPRAEHIWRTLDGTTYLMIGTHSKVYIDSGGLLTDVTPIRTTVTLGTDPFTTDGTTSLVTVTHTAHGAFSGDYVTFSGATDTGGILAAYLNGEHQITKIDDDTYTFVAGMVSTSVANGGGASVSAEYQINVGQIDGLFGYGFGAGAWSAGFYGLASPTGIDLFPRTWSIDNWGEDVIFCPRGGSVYLWDATNPTARATRITQAPSKTNAILVTKDRHLVCFGCNVPGNDASAQDQMQIRWCNQEDYTDWTVTVTNTAGDQYLTGGTRIVTAAAIEGQVIVWTDLDVHSMQYIGPPYTFGFQQIGTGTGIAGPNAWIAHNNTVYWMGRNSFYVYSGGMSLIPCTVQRFIFSNVNTDNIDKTFAVLSREFQEITWFYPTETVEDTALLGDIGAAATTINVETTAGFPQTGSIRIGAEVIDYTDKNDTQFTGCSRGARGTTAAAHSDEDAVSDPDGNEAKEPCRYVTLSLIEKSWWIGRLERTAWKDKGALAYPIAMARWGNIYRHEIGYDADGEPLAAFIQSSDFDIGEGDALMSIKRVIPDFTIEGGSVDLKFKTRYYPLSSQVKETVGNVTSSTTKIDTRIRGRQMALRIESDEVGDWWKYGSTRIDQFPDGRR